MKYISTRLNDKALSTKEAILRGIASDGGLFMPEELKKINLSSKIKEKMDYREFAYAIISQIFDDLNENELKDAINLAYSKENFSKENCLDLKKVDDFYLMELYYGRTAAFKDFALSLLPYFIKMAKKGQEKIAILTATSGDTGKAALAAFKDLDDTEIIVFYPTEGVSIVQKYQMMTQEGKNCHAIGILGNFDEAQSALKTIFNDKDLEKFFKEKSIRLSSANSINIGRLVPQIVYYFYAYYKLVKSGEIEDGEEINIGVPTGNFGNILASYLAKEMGLRIKNFIVASNRNNVLSEFFKTGVYNADREFYKTNSPSMDILISSNLERLLFLKAPQETKKFMEDLKNNKSYKLSEKLLKSLEEFKGYYMEDWEVIDLIGQIFDENSYLMDTHTAVCYGACQKYREESGDPRKIIIASTASPYKFPKSIGEALKINCENEFDLIEKIHKKTSIEVPENLKSLDKKKLLQDKIIDKEEIKNTVKEILGENNDN
ncbi:threonine synthase [Peptoniphilus raoultii]|uniref:threonine synthase n=1 Tax=Peptoniphilus raoultii TaxID=1776387 RepID=UPI0008D99B48|nr:threonine synthase [Peptoniphilus raoultii]